MKDILWISPFAPYDNVAHAGGKTENYFLKGVFFSKRFRLAVITCYLHNEKSKLDLDKYGINNRQIELDPNKIMRIFKKIINAESTLNPWNRHACLLQNCTELFLKKAIKQYLLNNAEPDVIILEWTEVVLIRKYIQKLFPNARILAIEEDVAFLGYKRKADMANNILMKWFQNKRYKNLYKIEIEALQNVDKIMVYNDKDAKLLLNNNIPNQKLFNVSVCFDDFLGCQHKRLNKDIIYYGAMSRLENYLSAIWFIRNVLPKIEDKECRFIIIGANPPKKLLQYSSRQVQVLGFVEDVSTYFESSLCLVAPLLLGAGIKVKILEAMSAGIPVLTNSIGIEGIPAEDGVHYLHCESAEDYLGKINTLLKNPEMDKELSYNSKQFIQAKYDKKESLKRLISELENL